MFTKFGRYARAFFVPGKEYVIENRPSILWFQDGVALKSPEHQGEKLDLLTHKLIKLVGHPGFEHVVVFPQQCRRRMGLPLTPESTIVDLTGVIGQRETEHLPNIPVIGRFRISRLRNVLSPRLDGAGFLLTMDTHEISQLKSNINFDNPVLIDDVAWSGRTVLEAISILGLDPSNTSFAGLVVNEGHFGEGKPGAKDLLLQKGLKKIIAGEIVRTPNHDGFHLADFFENRALANKEVFKVVIQIQKLREVLAAADEGTKRNIESQIRSLLAENREVLFPSAKSSEQLKRLQEDGKVVTQGGIPKDTFFDTNPPNWLMPSFSRRVRSDMLLENTEEIVDVLKRLNDILNLRRFI